LQREKSIVDLPNRRKRGFDLDYGTIEMLKKKDEHHRVKHSSQIDARHAGPPKYQQIDTKTSNMGV